MIVDNLDILFQVLGVTFLFFLLFYIGYRKFLLSVFDPLLVFILTMSFSATLIVFIVTDFKFLFLFFLCQFTFWAGFVYQAKPSAEMGPQHLCSGSRSIRLLQIVTVVSFLVYLVANLYMIGQVGVTLMQDDPSTAKVASFSGGLGLVRRINWGLGNFLAASTIVCLFISKIKVPFFLLLLVEMLFTMMNGSKSGIISFLTIFILISAIKEIGDTRMMKKAKRTLPVMLLASIAVAIYILYKGSSSLEEAFYGFATRLLYSGDVAFYYYDSAILKFYSSFNTLDYLYHELNPILGMFRIAEYQEPFGYQMLVKSLPQYFDFGAVKGPNTPFYVKGHIFFGDWGCGFYAFFAGGLIGNLRYRFLMVNSNSLIFKVFLISVSNIVFLYATESNLLIGQIFDTIFFLVPIVVISLFIYEILYNPSLLMNELSNDPAT